MDQNYCVKLTEMSLQGDEFSNEYSFFNLNYERCKNNCITDVDDINDYFEGKSLIVYVVESYYDANSPNNPVKQYISTDAKIPLSSSLHSRMKIYVRENEVRLLNGTVLTFYDVAYKDVISSR